MSLVCVTQFFLLKLFHFALNNIDWAKIQAADSVALWLGLSLGSRSVRLLVLSPVNIYLFMQSGTVSAGKLEINSLLNT